MLNLLLVLEIYITLTPGIRVNTRYINFTRGTSSEDVHPEHVPLVEFMYLVFTRMSGESYCR